MKVVIEKGEFFPYYFLRELDDWNDEEVDAIIELSEEEVKTILLKIEEFKEFNKFLGTLYKDIRNKHK